MRGTSWVIFGAMLLGVSASAQALVFINSTDNQRYFDVAIRTPNKEVLLAGRTGKLWGASGSYGGGGSEVLFDNLSTDEKHRIMRMLAQNRKFTLYATGREASNYAPPISCEQPVEIQSLGDIKRLTIQAAGHLAHHWCHVTKADLPTPPAKIFTPEQLEKAARFLQLRSEELDRIPTREEMIEVLTAQANDIGLDAAPERAQKTIAAILEELAV